METLDKLGRRIERYQDLRTIVRTMRALSAVNIRQFEKAVTSIREYFNTVEKGLQVAIREGGETISVEGSPYKNTGVVIFGSDHGLCGHFNEDLANHALDELENLGTAAQQPRILPVGERMAVQMKHPELTVETGLSAPATAARITTTVQHVLLRLDDWIEAKDIGRVQVFYNRHLSQSGYEPGHYWLLPLSSAHFQHLYTSPWPSRCVPALRANAASMTRRLLRQYLFVSLFRATAESLASEHGSRLAAMQTADRNLADHLEKLTMQHQRLRQNSITTELLDVVSGFEALTGGLK